MSEIFPEISSNFARFNSRNRFENNTNGSQDRSIIKNDSLNESFGQYVTSFAVYKLLSEIIKPFTAFDVYRAGLIDANGNILKSEGELTPEEKNLLNPFTRLVIGIKRLVQALPGNRLKADFKYISTAGKAMAFECSELGGDGELFLEELEKTLDVLLEDGEGGGVGNEMGGGFSNPQVGEPNPALAGYSPPLGATGSYKPKERSEPIRSGMASSELNSSLPSQQRKISFAGLINNLM